MDRTGNGNLFFTAGIDNSGLRADAEESRNILHGIGQTALLESANIDSAFGKIGKAIGGIFAISQIKDFASHVISLRGEIESLEISFNTLLGSDTKGSAMFSEIREFAAQTPMMLKDLASGAQTMLAFNIEAEKVMPMLKAIGDISMGDADKFNSLALAFSQMSSTGKLMAQDLLQMINAGFNPLSVISQKTGKSIGELREEMEKGKISVEMVTDAFITATSEGGQFYDMLTKQSTGLKGSISKLRGAVDDMFNAIGTSSQGAVTTMIGGATEVVKHWDTVGLILADIAAAYGVQKAVEAGASAVATSSYKAEIAALSTLLPAKESNIAADLQEAVAKGTITEATAAKVMAMREEVAAHLEALAATEAAAKAEAVAAAQKYRAALKESLAAKAAVAAKREELVASGEICGAYISENAVKEMGIVTERAKAASIQATAAKQEYAVAVTNKKAASEALETAQTSRNTVAQNLNTTSTGILTVAKETLTKATQKLYATMMANPYALLTAAVLALGYGIYKLATYQTDAEKAIKSAEAAVTSQNSSMEEELKTLNDLNDKLNKTKKGTQEWKEVKDSIVSQFGKYNSGLDDEITKTGTLTSSYKELTKAIRMSAAARAMEKYRQDNQDDTLSVVDDALEKSQNKLKKKFVKRDKNGRPVRDEHGKLIYTFLTKEYQNLLQSAAYEYIMTGKLPENLSKKDRAYMHFTGMLSEGSVFNRGVLVKARDKQKAYNAGEQKVAERYNTTVDAIDGIKTEPSSNSEETRNGDTIDKELKEKKEKLSKYKKNSAEYKKLTQEIASLQKERAEWGDESDLKTKKSTGATGATAEQLQSKEDSAHRKLLDLLKAQAEERLALRQAYELEEWQNRIDLMEEGEEKVLAQMRLDHTKEIATLRSNRQQAVKEEIARQKALFDAQEEEKAAGDKNYAKKVFNPGEDIEETLKALSEVEKEIEEAKGKLEELAGTPMSEDAAEEVRKRLEELQARHKELSDSMGDVTRKEVAEILSRYDQLYKQIQEKQKASYSERIKEAQKQLNQYLQAYGSYEQRRAALHEEYEQKIAQASPAERPLLKAEMRSKENDINFEEFTNTGLIAKAYGDIKKLSASTVKTLISEMEKYRSKIYETFDPEKIEAFESKLSELKDLDVENSFGIFSSFVPDAFQEAAKAEKEMAQNAERVAELKKQQAELQQKIMSEQGSIMGQARQQGVNVTLDDLDTNAFSNVAQKFQEAGKEMSQEMSSSISDMVGNMGQLGGITDSIGGMMGSMGEGGSNPLDMVGTVVHGINDSVQSLKALFDDLMETAELFGADTEVGSNWAQASIVMDGFAEASEGATNAFDSLKSGNPIGVIQGVVQSFTGWIKAFAKVKDAAKERTILDLQDQIDALQKSYDRLAKSIDDAYSVDASDMIEQQNEMLRQQKILIEQQIAEEESKKNTDEDRVEEWRDQLEEIDDLLKENESAAKEAIIGEDIKSAIDEFADAYTGAWEEGTNAAEKSMSVVKSLITSGLTEMLKKNLQPSVEKFYDYLAEALKKGYLTEADYAQLDAYKAEMDTLAEDGQALYEEILERYKDLDELREELTDISFDSVSDNFKSLLTDMDSSAADFADSFTDMLRNALAEGLMNDKYDLMLKEWYEEFADAMSDHTLTDTEREALRQKYESIVNQGIEDRNYINDIIGGDAYSQSGTSGGWASMGQDTAEELNGRFTALTELFAIGNEISMEGNRIAGEILTVLRGMYAGSSAEQPTLTEMRDMMFTQTGFLEDIAKYTKMLISIDSRIEYLNQLINKKL